MNGFMYIIIYVFSETMAIASIISASSNNDSLTLGIILKALLIVIIKMMALGGFVYYILTIEALI